MDGARSKMGRMRVFYAANVNREGGDENSYLLLRKLSSSHFFFRRLCLTHDQLRLVRHQRLQSGAVVVELQELISELKGLV